jgi:hypothetical protein
MIDPDCGAPEMARTADNPNELKHEVTKATKTHEEMWMNSFVRLRALRGFVLQTNSEAII